MRYNSGNSDVLRFLWSLLSIKCRPYREQEYVLPILLVVTILKCSGDGTTVLATDGFCLGYVTRTTGCPPALTAFRNPIERSLPISFGSHSCAAPARGFEAQLQRSSDSILRVSMAVFAGHCELVETVHIGTASGCARRNTEQTRIAETDNKVSLTMYAPRRVQEERDDGWP